MMFIQSKRSVSQPKTPARRGVMLLEVLVAAGLVMTLITVAVPVFLHSARIWKQTQHYQFAVDELSGQMDRLIAMPAGQRESALQTLSVSESIGEVLGEVTLNGNVVDDSDGRRIELSIDWPRIGTPPPVRLVAWIEPLSDDASQGSDASQNNEASQISDSNSKEQESNVDEQSDQKEAKS